MPALRAADAGLESMWSTRSGRASRSAFIIVVALMFAASATATLLGCASMASYAQPMPGGWMLSTMAPSICGQGVSAGACAFMAMWFAMTVAMMLPSVAPALWRYRCLLGHMRVPCADRQVAVAGAGYFATWLPVGVVACVLGEVAGDVLLQRPAWSRAMPALCGLVVVVAGVLQSCAWKRHHLACCRAGFARAGRTMRVIDAWCDGIRFGLHCNAACANLTAVLLAIGVMDVRAMLLVTVAVTAERWSAQGAWISQGIGIALVGLGACACGQAMA